MSYRRGITAAVFALALSTGGARAQDLIQNPSFATGDFTGYTVFFPSSGNASVDVGGFSQNTAILIAPTVAGQSPTTLSQTITTVPGAQYLISFLAVFDPGDYTYSFGTGNLELTPTTGCSTGSPCVLGGPFTFTGIATSNSTTLTFSALFVGVQGSGVEGFTQIDVEQETAGPAPVVGGGVASMMASLIALIRRRRTQRLGR